MSEKYNEYLREHRENVAKAADWMVKNLPELFLDDDFRSDCMWQCKQEHDSSKYEPEEYEAYDAYFYGGNRSFEVVERYNRAWLHHQHNNPHHWQHWVLINDNPKEAEIILDMPDIYIIEMICDWWSFSWKSGDLLEIFKWYDERSNYISLSTKTRKKVFNILDKMQNKLMELGIKDIQSESDENEN